MHYFALYHPEKYSRVVLENSGRGDDYDCPFARAAIELTKLLCEILKVIEIYHLHGNTKYHFKYISEISNRLGKHRLSKGPRFIPCSLTTTIRLRNSFAFAWWW